jgi:hypothetical protein
MIYESKMFVYITNCNIEWFEALFEKTDEHACEWLKISQENVFH